MRSLRVAALGILATFLGPADARAQRPLNLDFALPSVSYPDRPWGWSLGWSAFAPGTPATFTLDSLRLVSGRRSLRVVGRDSSGAPPFRSISLHLPADFARGRILELRGHFSAEELGGLAMVQLQAWGDRRVPAADSATLTAGQADRAWHPFALTVEVPNDSGIHAVYIALGVQGRGSAWFGDLSLTMDGKPIAVIPTAIAQPSAAQRRWLASRSAPLHSVEPPAPIAPAASAGSAASAAPREPAGNSDLALFDRIVGDARVVGLGESTHGTREFFQVKHRFLEHLVRTQGFDLFAIEANQLAVERLNQFVLGGPGTVREAMRVMFRVWNTDEMQALVEWARRHNAANPRQQVRFVGYDMQDHRLPTDSLLALIRRVEPALSERATALTAEYRAQGGYTTPNVAESIRAAWHARADSLWREVTERRARWLATSTTRTDSMAVEWGVQNANLLRQAAYLNVTLNSPDRDSLMAANLDWALRVLYPRSRVVVWAHDVHVSHGGDPRRSFNAGAQMGAHLKHSYRLDYRAFSLVTRAGSYSATRSFTDHQVISARAWPAPEGSIEHLLASLPRPRTSVGVIVDLRVPEGDAAGGWLWQPRHIRHVGYAAYDYAFEMRAVMPLEFDGVIFIDQTTPSRMF